jgi:UDP-N-acetylglucosamine 4-epimerase
VVQANLLAGTVANPEAVNQVYNVALGEQTSLNELFASLRELLCARDAAFECAPAVYRDFRAGDVRFSRADIGKAKSNLGFRPACPVHEGLKRALDWYVARLAPERAAPREAAAVAGA